DKFYYLKWYAIIGIVLSPICIIYFDVYLGRQYIIDLCVTMGLYVLVVVVIVFTVEYIIPKYIKNVKETKAEFNKL
ncbi:MAG: hypothetical protein ACFFDT_23895, partial [Candidatus Hodarchaeota archaeon]